MHFPISWNKFSNALLMLPLRQRHLAIFHCISACPRKTKLDQSTKQSNCGMIDDHLLICSHPLDKALQDPQCSFLPGLIVNAGSSGQGASVPCTADPSSVPRAARYALGPPPPGLPASSRMSNNHSHMWSCRKTDAVFPFVKSSCWNGVRFMGTVSKRANIKVTVLFMPSTSILCG